jgi:polar amino acid transport system substrate-binding protein
MMGLVLTVIGCGENKKQVPGAAESMKKYNAVRIATYAVTAPFEYGKDTGVQGLDVDIGNEIGKTLGLEVKWLKASSYEQLFDYLRNGDAEIVISAVAVDPKRMEDFSFSHPYYESGDIITVQQGKVDIKSLADLSGKTVGVAAGRYGDAFMSSRKGIAIKKYKTLDDTMGGLNQGEVAAVVGDEPFISYSSVESFPNTMTLPGKVNKYQYAVVVRKSEPQLLAKVNETIDRMKASGEIEKLASTWMGDKIKKAEENYAKAVENIRLLNAPKSISVNIIKSSGTWNPDRLDGYKLVLEGPSGTYASTPILMDGNKGHCKFTSSVPPADYRINITILKMVANVTVPKLPKTSLTMDLTIGRDITILFK